MASERPIYAGQLCCGCVVFVYEDDPVAERMEAIWDDEESMDRLDVGCPLHRSHGHQMPTVFLDGKAVRHRHSFLSFMRLGDGAGYVLP